MFKSYSPSTSGRETEFKAGGRNKSRLTYSDSLILSRTALGTAGRDGKGNCADKTPEEKGASLRSVTISGASSASAAISMSTWVETGSNEPAGRRREREDNKVGAAQTTCPVE